VPVWPDAAGAGPPASSVPPPPRRDAAAPSRRLEPPDAVFAALADPTRRRVLRAVAERGPVTATALADGLPVSRQAVAKHLALLRAAGLVAAERSGRETHFTARSQPLDELATWAEQAGRRWDDRLARLRSHLD
jgi:DNA-binding transcriptional ArsR family regulator